MVENANKLNIRDILIVKFRNALSANHIVVEV